MTTGRSEASGTSATPPKTSPFQAITELSGLHVLTMLAGLARTKILALLVGPEGVGVVGVIDQIVSLVTQIGSLSLPFAAVKFLSRVGAENREQFARLYRALLVALVTGTGTAAVIGLLIALGGPELFGAELAPFRGTLVAALVGVPAVGTLPLLRNVLAATGLYRASAVTAFLAGIGVVATTYVGIRWLGLTGYYLGHLIVFGSVCIGVIVYLARAHHIRPRGDATLAVLRGHEGLATFAGGMYVLGFTAPTAFLFSRAIVLVHHGASAVGFLSAAFGIGLAIRLVLNQANGMYLTPRVNRAAPVAERAAEVGEYIRVLTVVVVGSALVVVLWPRFWLTVLYAPPFREAAGFLAVFVLAELLVLIAGVYGALLIGVDDIRGYVVLMVTGHATVIALTFVLGPSRGALGVGIAFVCGNGLLLALTLLRLAVRHGAQASMRGFAGLTAALAGLAAAGWWAGSSSPPGFVWRVGILLGGTTLFATRLRAEEWRWLLAPWSRRRGD